MLEANPIHIRKLQTKTNNFQHSSNYFPPLCVFYRPDENDVIKSFFLSNSSSKTGRMFILHTLIKITRSTFWQSFSLITSFLCILQTRIIFYVLVSKIRSANRNSFKLSQLGDFMSNQSWKFQFKRLTTAVFISWSVFSESGSRGPCKDEVRNLFSLIHTLHLISSIVLQSFNVITSFLCILQTRTVFKVFGL